MGVAYATPYGNQIPLNEITIMQNWGERQKNTDKIPSVISFSPADEKMQRQWGYDLSHGAVAMIQTKLELDVQDISHELELIIQNLDGMNNLETAHIMRSGGSLDFTYMSAEDVVTEYLSRVFEQVLSAVEKFSKPFLETTSVDVVVTVPTVSTYLT